MNWVVFGVLVGFAALNLLGVGLYHNFYYNHQKSLPEEKRKTWYKDPEFWKWTISLLIFGAAYSLLRLIIWLRSLIKGTDE